MARVSLPFRDASPDQTHGELEPRGLELTPAWERQTPEAQQLVQLDTHAKSASRPRPVTALDHVGVEKPRAQSLRRLPAARRSGSPRLARAHAKVGEEVPEVERRFRLADGVEVDQTALLAGEEQLRWAEVPVAEARWPGVGPPRVRGCRFEPFMERCTQVGRETLEDDACLGQFDQLVRGRAVRPKRDAGGMEARRDASGRVDRSPP